jgi:hypothetical protein
MNFKRMTTRFQHTELMDLKRFSFEKCRKDGHFINLVAFTGCSRVKHGKMIDSPFLYFLFTGFHSSIRKHLITCFFADGARNNL